MPTLSPTLELAIRDTLSMMPYFIAIEGTPAFDAIAAVCREQYENQELMETFMLTEVAMPDGSLADAIVVSQLPTGCCATL